MTNRIKYFFTYVNIILLITAIANISTPCQSKIEDSANNFAIIKHGESPDDIVKQAANVHPSKLQYDWQKLEFTAFVHFGINTFDRVEWGQKDIDISKYNPKKLDARQWVKVFKDAGMKMVILVAKHHDGFCQWPTKYTKLNISNTPFQNGKGDIARDLSKACREAGLKFGFYLSPWDMHEKSYGTPEYNNFFKNLLTELLTNYGEISEVWFDGANGEGPNGKKQVYDWHSYYELIRKLQPHAAIAICGPDVRWVGTESGYGRETEWSVIPASNMNQDEIAAKSQQKALDAAFVPKDLMDKDLGSRKKLETATTLCWYPAEVDVSIRPRWFYNSDDDQRVKTPAKLVDIYYNSVGMNALLLLNVPPDTNGLINKNDIKSLQGMRYILDKTFKVNIARNAAVKATSEKKGNPAKNIVDNKLNTYWTTPAGIDTASLEIKLKREQTFNRVMLQENILAGQRIEKFHLEFWNGGSWNKFAEGTTVGYKRLLRFSTITADRIKLVIDQCRTNPTIASFGLYMAPPEVSFESGQESFSGSTFFKLSCDVKDAKIYYTLDGSIPTKQSNLYTGEITLKNTTKVTAIAISQDGVKSLPVSTEYNKAKYEIKYLIPYDDQYPGVGNYTLVDGASATTNLNDNKWQGFNGKDLDVIIDLNGVKKISKISCGFLRDINSFIFLPKSVEYSISDNGKDFTLLKEIKNNDLDNQDKKTLIKKFETNVQASGRYIHVKANSIGTCPAWHKGVGEKAWLFADEITVE
jgi:alpha-L-fucosidase